MQDYGSLRGQSGRASQSHTLRVVDGVTADAPAPEALRAIEILSHRGPRAHCDPDEARLRYRESRTPFLAPLQDVDSVFEVHTPDKPPLKVIRPIGFKQRTLHTGVIFLHGGGWTVGDFETYEPLCREIANAMNAVLV